jgi:hypothetical protein
MPVRKRPRVGLVALWESGVPLDSAWIEFAAFFDRFAFRALHTDPINDPEVLEPDPRYKELSKGWLPKTLEAREKKLAGITKNERIHLLGEIYAGRLWAVGFRTLENGDDEPARIPRQQFLVDEDGELTPPTRIGWATGELTTATESYFDIRVVRPRVDNQTGQPDTSAPAARASRPDTSDEGGLPTPATEFDWIQLELADTGESYIGTSVARSPVADQTSQPDEGTPAVRAGRPNTSAQIRKKVEELWNTQSFQAIGSRKKQAREVRAQLCGEEHRADDGMPNYKSSVIMRIIGRVARAQPPQTGGTE